MQKNEEPESRGERRVAPAAGPAPSAPVAHETGDLPDGWSHEGLFRLLGEVGYLLAEGAGLRDPQHALRQLTHDGPSREALIKRIGRLRDAERQAGQLAAQLGEAKQVDAEVREALSQLLGAPADSDTTANMARRAAKLVPDLLTELVGRKDAAAVTGLYDLTLNLGEKKPRTMHSMRARPSTFLGGGIDVYYPDGRFYGTIGQLAVYSILPRVEEGEAAEGPRPDLSSGDEVKP